MVGFDFAKSRALGWFLLNAAGASYRQIEMMRRLRGLKVADVTRRALLARE
jgi:hypothetical protein